MVFAMKLTLDKMNRVVIPKEIRARIGIGPGDEFEISLAGDEIRLRQTNPRPLLLEKNGLLVCTSEVPEEAWDIGSFLDKQRESRSLQAGGV